METRGTEILKISHLSRSFDKLSVLNDVNFSVYNREIICVLGPSGCGKTTLLKVLAGLIPFDEGNVVLNGKEAAGRRLKQRETGMVFQEPRLLPWRTAFDNVALPFELMGTAIDAAVKQTVSAALSLVELSDFAGSYPHELSGGMRQRVSLARALATNPGMLFMDEPLSGLDVHSRGEFMEQILRVWGHKRLTLLWVTHDLREAIRIADRIIVLSRRPGTVVATLPVPHPRREHSGGAEESELEITLKTLFE